MLPQFEPIVPGHCVILPLQHESVTRAVDISVWEEIHNLKRCLLKMFALQGKDVIFMETACAWPSNGDTHSMIECIHPCAPVWEEIQLCHGDCHVLGQATEMKFQTKRSCMYLEKVSSLLLS